MRTLRLPRLSAAIFCLCIVLSGGVRAARADPTDVLRFAAISLRDAEAVAVEQSPDVDAARANVDAAAAGLAQARGATGLSAIANYTEVPQSGGAPNLTWAQRISSFGLQATLGDIAVHSPLVMQASAALSQAVSDELVAERNERLKVVGLYFTAVQARADLSAKNDAVDSARDFEDDVRKRYEARKLPFSDLLRAQVALSKARADAANAQGVDVNAADALAREIGRRADDLRDTVAETVPPLEVLDDDRAIARAFAQRPELQSAEQNVRAAKAGLAAARRAVIPPITITGGYASGVDSGTNIGGPALSASLQIPLGANVGATIRAQQAAVRIAMAKADAARRALAIEVGAAVHTASAAIIARDETDETLEEATSALKFVSEEYRTGAAIGLSVTDARAIYDQAVIDDIAAQYAELRAQATLDVELAP